MNGLEHPAAPRWLRQAGAPYRAAVIGGGSWGTAFARHLVSRDVETSLLARRAEQAQAMQSSRHNPDYLTHLELPAELSYGTYGSADLSEIALLVMAVPSKAYGDVVRSLSSRLPVGIGVLSLTKGVEPIGLRRLSEVLETELAALSPRVAVLSGPNHAEEVAEDQPTASVIASSDEVFAASLQDMVTGETLRAYVNGDLIGVEFAGAVKNIIAVATGMSDGLGFGDNARAALITRGLAEMTRLGLAFGAKSETFSGLAGLGDLVGTCTSRHSRNRLAGEMIARGHPPDTVESEMGMIAEGLTAAPAILAIARRAGVELPITENVVAILSKDKDVRTSVRDLMTRHPRSESA